MNEFLKEAKNGISCILGVLLIFVGCIGIFVPVIPGILLIFMGIYLIGGRNFVKKFKNTIRWIKQKNWR